MARLFSNLVTSIGRDFGFTPAASGEVTLPAIYYTVFFNSNGGSAVASQVYLSGETYSEPTPPTRQGYTFNGWSSTPTIINSNITLTASWTLIPQNVRYTLYFYADVPGIVDPVPPNSWSVMETDSGTIIGTIGLPNTPTKNGYTFNGWNKITGGGTSYAPFDFNTTPITSNMSFCATWQFSGIETPNIIGLTETQALNTLSLHGLQGSIMYSVPSSDPTYSNWRTELTIANQYPSPGTPVQPGDSIGYTYYVTQEDVVTYAIAGNPQMLVIETLKPASDFGPGATITVTNAMSFAMMNTQTYTVTNILNTSYNSQSQMNVFTVEVSRSAFIYFTQNLFAGNSKFTSTPPPPTFSGGTLLEGSSNWYRVFTSSGTFSASNITAPMTVQAEIITVGGGGGGSADRGGAGGAGAFDARLRSISNGNYSVVVGAGGAGVAGGQGADGYTSRFGTYNVNPLSTLTQGAGGGGGGSGGGDITSYGRPGGSGGGAGNWGEWGNFGVISFGGTAFDPDFGHNGGNGIYDFPSFGSGGGGGAGAPGQDGTVYDSGNGGAGNWQDLLNFNTDLLSGASFGISDINNRKMLAAGGGAGNGNGGTSGYSGYGSSAYSGSGSYYSDPELNNAYPNSGSGGGSVGYGQGGNGGSGIVIIRYPKAVYVDGHLVNVINA